MEEGSQITLNSGARLYAWGYISGSGTIHANSGSSVYENFQIADFRGGTATLAMKKNSYGVFLLNQYYIQNVEVPLTLDYGAEEHVTSSVYMSGSAYSAGDVVLVGENSGLFSLSQGTSLTKRYDSTTDRQMFTLSGSATLGAISIDVAGASISSNDFVLPLTNNMTITVESGTLTSNNDIAMLAGVDITIKNGATLDFTGGDVYVYDHDEWMSGKYTISAYFKPVSYSPTKAYTRTTDRDLPDAKIDVQGALNVSGHLYTTAGGANICCTGNPGTITFASGAGTSTTTYQAEQTGSDISYSSIAITSAQLQNADGSYVATSGVVSGTTYYYSAKAGTWSTEQEQYELGDVNLDGAVDVNDVTALVDIILGSWGDEVHGDTDINADGAVDVNDVTALVDLILGKE